MSKYNLNEGNESLKKILLLMKYDNKKTLTENVEEIDSDISEEIKEDLSDVTTASTVAGAGLGAATAVGTGTATAAVTVPVMSALGVGAATAGAIVGGAGALALAPLVYWLVTKDSEYPKIEAMFQMCSTNAQAFKKLKPKLSNSDIRQMSDDIYDAVNYTWGTDEDLLFGAFNRLNDGNASDFCALIQYYNKQGENLLSDLDGDIDMSSEWKKIYRPIRNCVEDSLIEIGKMAEDEEIEGVVPVVPEDGEGKEKEDGKKSKYKECTGTYKKYCYNKEVIGKVQRCLEITDDGAFGPKTQAALEKAGFKNGFTDADVDKICKSTDDGKKEEPNVKIIDDTKDEVEIETITTNNDTINVPDANLGKF